MRIHKKLKSFISLLCAVSLLFSVSSIPTFAVTDNAVTATTNTTVKQGATAYCYIYIDSTESLSALDVTVHFDNTKIKATNIYNSITCTLYDSVKNDSSIQFSYIFDGEGTSSKTRLFYFTYQVLSDAEIGNAYFDITIGEAYDNSLNSVAVSGSRCNFDIAKTVTTKTCSVYSNSRVSTLVEEEFSLSYRFSTYQIASGSVVITYDPEVFDVVEITKGGFLGDKVTDVNTELAGSIYLSFVGTSYNTNADLVTVKFKTLKNVSETSKISLKVTELYDMELNAVSCFGYTTTASVIYDESYVGDAPKMTVCADYNESTEQVTAVISLEENSNLGAGDFMLVFNPAVLTLSSYSKNFKPSFFNINDKEAAEGILKFSIISLEDITTEETVLTVVFDTIQNCTEKTAMLDISGSMLSDSLTNAILLNFVNEQVTIPEKHIYSSDCDTTCNLCNSIRNISVSHVYIATVIPSTCTEAGVMTYTCGGCGDTYTEAIPAMGHTKVTDPASEPTCGEDGLTEGSHCSACGAVITAQESVPAKGHTETPDAALAPTCTEAGLTEGSHCSDCGETIKAQEEVPAKGHSYENWQCTECGERDPEAPDHVPGDVNGDGKVDTKDLTRLMKYISGEDVTVFVSDVNGDGSVNTKDLTRLMKHLAGDDVVIF